MVKAEAALFHVGYVNFLNVGIHFVLVQRVPKRPLITKPPFPMACPFVRRWCSGFWRFLNSSITRDSYSMLGSIVGYPSFWGSFLLCWSSNCCALCRARTENNSEEQQQTHNTTHSVHSGISENKGYPFGDPYKKGLVTAYYILGSCNLTNCKRALGCAVLLGWGWV